MPVRGGEESPIGVSAMTLRILLLSAIMWSSHAAYAQSEEWKYEVSSWTTVTSVEEFSASLSKSAYIRCKGLILDDWTTLDDSIELKGLWFFNCQVRWAELAKWKVLRNVKDFRVEVSALGQERLAELSDRCEADPGLSLVLQKMAALQWLYLDIPLVGEDLSPAFSHGYLRGVAVEREWSMTNTIIVLLGECADLAHLRLPATRFGCERQLLQLLESNELETLDVRLPLLRESSAELLEAIATHKSMKCLRIRGYAIHDNMVLLKEDFFVHLASLGNLQSLELDGVEFAQDIGKSIGDALGSLFRLRCLKLVRVTGFQNGWLTSISKLPRLEELNLGIASLGDEEVEPLQGSRALRRIDVRDCPLLTECCLDSVAVIPTLVQLSIGFRLSDDGLRRLHANSRLLQVNGSGRGNAALGSVADEWPAYKYRMDLSECVDVSAPLVLNLLKRFESVDSVAVDLGSGDWITPALLKSVVSMLPGLRWLNVRAYNLELSEELVRVLSRRPIRSLGVHCPPGFDVGSLACLSSLFQLSISGDLVSTGDSPLPESMHVREVYLTCRVTVKALEVLLSCKSLAVVWLDIHSALNVLSNDDIKLMRTRFPQVTIIVRR